MIRTKHLFIATAFGLLMTIGGGSAALVQRMTPAFTQPAAVVLGVPDETYPVAPRAQEATERDEFMERIRASYVPPPANEGAPTEREAEPILIDPAPAPIPEPVPTSIPVAVTTEPASAASGDAATSTATAPDATSTPSDTTATWSQYGNADI